ncbi:hypothetical protein [Burkholderia sp. D-99]|uniref:hypothetical protein n=1 Tax=Burkholderia sp. D-99 TaxID=2717316 RepID=UPI0014227716|nr:hypothetical protein [Burkholderia sp. D-99]NHV28287.1 hypothetical protein [Burkholderia sp. D-99]
MQESEARLAVRHPLAERFQRERDGVLARLHDQLNTRIVEGVYSTVKVIVRRSDGHRDSEDSFVATAINLKINS